MYNPNYNPLIRRTKSAPERKKKPLLLSPREGDITPNSDAESDTLFDVWGAESIPDIHLKFTTLATVATVLAPTPAKTSPSPSIIQLLSSLLCCCSKRHRD